MNLFTQWTGITHTDMVVLFCVAAYCFMARKSLLPRVREHMIDSHFGDFVGLFLVIVGVAMIMIAPLYQNQVYYTQICTAAGGLVSAGFIALKLKTNAPENTSTTVVSTSPPTPVTLPSVAPPSPVAATSFRKVEGK